MTSLILAYIDETITKSGGIFDDRKWLFRILYVRISRCEFIDHKISPLQKVMFILSFGDFFSLSTCYICFDLYLEFGRSLFDQENRVG